MVEGTFKYEGWVAVDAPLIVKDGNLANRHQHECLQRVCICLRQGAAADSDSGACVNHALGRHDDIPALVNLDGPKLTQPPNKMVMMIALLKRHWRGPAQRRTVDVGIPRGPIIENIRQHLCLGILVALLRAPVHRFVLDPRSADARALHISTTLDAKREERARAAQVRRNVLAPREHPPAREPNWQLLLLLRTRARVVEDRGAADLRRVLGWVWEGDRGARPGAWDTWDIRKGRRKLGARGPAGAAWMHENIPMCLLPSQPAGELVPLFPPVPIDDGSGGQQLCTLSFQVQQTGGFDGRFGWDRRHFFWGRDRRAGTARRVLLHFLCGIWFRVYKVFIMRQFRDDPPTSTWIATVPELACSILGRFEGRSATSGESSWNEAFLLFPEGWGV